MNGGPVAAATIATRAAGLDRLAAFVPRAGIVYARQRNHDDGPGSRNNVSGLSAYVRHRLVSEREIVEAVLARHSPAASEKFIQEVCWRTYWKGWLELRPAVWRHYEADVVALRRDGGEIGSLRERLDAAETGRTGIACFDAWSRELVETGYLHNHTRMWFASIWAYTLKLPWQLGADFFMRHLLDGDPACNTLSWRWVVGLQTPGKTYLARAANITEYTAGRFDPGGQLAREAPPLTDSFEMPKPFRLMPPVPLPGRVRVTLVLTEDDLDPAAWSIGDARVTAVAGLRASAAYPGVSTAVSTFKDAALADAVARAQQRFACPVLVAPADRVDVAHDVMGLADRSGAAVVATMHLPVGPASDAVRPVLGAIAAGGWPVHTLRRDWDDLFWPHATHGFFKLKAKIPAVLAQLQTSRAPELPFG